MIEAFVLFLFGGLYLLLNLALSLIPLLPILIPLYFIKTFLEVRKFKDHDDVKGYDD